MSDSEGNEEVENYMENEIEKPQTIEEGCELKNKPKSDKSQKLKADERKLAGLKKAREMKAKYRAERLAKDKNDKELKREAKKANYKELAKQRKQQRQTNQTNQTNQTSIVEDEICEDPTPEPVYPASPAKTKKNKTRIVYEEPSESDSDSSSEEEVIIRRKKRTTKNPKKQPARKSRAHRDFEESDEDEPPRLKPSNKPSYNPMPSPYGYGGYRNPVFGIR